MSDSNTNETQKVSAVYPDSYPDFEQSWIMEETQPMAIPLAGLIVSSGSDGLGVKFQDDEFPGLYPEQNDGKNW